MIIRRAWLEYTACCTQAVLHAYNAEHNDGKISAPQECLLVARRPHHLCAAGRCRRGSAGSASCMCWPETGWRASGGTPRWAAAAPSSSPFARPRGQPQRTHAALRTQQQRSPPIVLASLVHAITASRAAAAAACCCQGYVCVCVCGPCLCVCTVCAGPGRTRCTSTATLPDMCFSFSVFLFFYYVSFYLFFILFK